MQVRVLVQVSRSVGVHSQVRLTRKPFLEEDPTILCSGFGRAYVAGHHESLWTSLGYLIEEQEGYPC